MVYFPGRVKNSVKFLGRVRLRLNLPGRVRVRSNSHVGLGSGLNTR